LQPIVTIK